MNACRPYICIQGILVVLLQCIHTVYSVHMCVYVKCVRVCGSDWASVCGRQGGRAFDGAVHSTVCVIYIQGARNFQKF